MLTTLPVRAPTHDDAAPICRVDEAALDDTLPFSLPFGDRLATSFRDADAHERFNSLLGDALLQVHLSGTLRVAAASTEHYVAISMSAQRLRLLLDCTGRSLIIVPRTGRANLINQGLRVVPGMIGYASDEQVDLEFSTFSGCIFSIKEVETEQESRSRKTNFGQVLPLKGYQFDLSQSLEGLFALLEAGLLSDLNLRKLPCDLLGAILTACSCHNDPPYDTTTAKTVPKSVKVVCDAFDLDPTQPLSLPEMVSLSGVSTRTLQYQFQSAFGMSPLAWQTCRRLELAKAALTEACSKQTVTEIAFNFGFASSSAFSQAFRKRYGVSPSEVRSAAIQR